MVSCASCGCTKAQKGTDAGITFHRFPKDEKRRKMWVQFVNKLGFILKPSSCLCSHHFSEDCFDRTSNAQVRLRPNATPTIKVDRLKYVRTYNPIVTRHSSCEEITSDNQFFLLRDLHVLLDLQVLLGLQVLLVPHL